MNEVWKFPEFYPGEDVSLAMMRDWYSEFETIRVQTTDDYDSRPRSELPLPYNRTGIPIRIIEAEGSSSDRYRAREVRWNEDALIPAWEDRLDGYVSPEGVFDFRAWNNETNVYVGYCTEAWRDEINEGWRFEYSPPMTGGGGSGPSGPGSPIVIIINGGSVDMLFWEFDFLTITFLEHTVVNLYNTWIYNTTSIIEYCGSMTYCFYEAVINSVSISLTIPIVPIILFVPTTDATIHEIITTAYIPNTKIYLFNTSDLYTITLKNDSVSATRPEAKIKGPNGKDIKVPPKTGITIYRPLLATIDDSRWVSLVGTSDPGGTNPSSGGSSASMTWLSYDKDYTFFNSSSSGAVVYDLDSSQSSNRIIIAFFIERTTDFEDSGVGTPSVQLKATVRPATQPTEDLGFGIEGNNGGPYAEGTCLGGTAEFAPGRWSSVKETWKPAIELTSTSAHNTLNAGAVRIRFLVTDLP